MFSTRLTFSYLFWYKWPPKGGEATSPPGRVFTRTSLKNVLSVLTLTFIFFDRPKAGGCGAKPRQRVEPVGNLPYPQGCPQGAILFLRPVDRASYPRAERRKATNGAGCDGFPIL